MKKLFVILILLFQYAYANELSNKSIKNILSNNAAVPSIPKNHPDYPASLILKTFNLPANASPTQIINKLNLLLIDSEFTVISKHLSDTKANLFIGTVGAYNLWRDLLYYQLGCAYYQTSDIKNAIHYLGGIPASSPIALIGMKALAWSHLKNLSLKKAQTVLNRIHKIKTKNDQEIDLIDAYIKATKQQNKLAILKANPLSFKNSNVLQSIRLKILSQAYFNDFLKNHINSTFDIKQKIFNNIISILEKIPTSQRDSQTSFLASETYWHYASTLRIKDPIKNNKILKKYLKHADNWISPWVVKSIDKGTPLLNEEAMFFSIAVSWERQDIRTALSRLHQFPKLFPQGEFLEDTYQLLGDYFYDQKQFRNAINQYRKLSKVASEDKAIYGVYKAAWSFYNLQKKWTALRHFERLLLHYRKNNTVKAGLGLNLLKETHNDLFLIMAELMPFTKSTKELEIFKYNEKEKINEYELLAQTYNKIGKYTDAIGIWKNLLNNYPTNSKTYSWLEGLLDSQYNMGERQILASIINKFHPSLPEIKNKDKYIKEKISLKTAIDKMLLSVHKEARKTDDPSLWSSCDDLYAIYENIFPQSQSGDIWYFGAQRFEAKDNFFKSIEWYQRASLVKTKFDGKADSALSTLRILNQLIEKAGLDPKTPQKTYSKISKNANWFIDNFPKMQQKELADYIFVESLAHSGEIQEASDYITRKYKNLGKNKWNIFLTHNKRLYSQKKWNHIYTFSDSMLKVAEQEKQKYLKNQKQESAFQIAFKGKDGYLSWYKNAIAVNNRTLISLKAWHNSLLSFKDKQYNEKYIDILSLFSKDHWANKKPESLSYEENRLIFEIYTHAFGKFKGFNAPLKQANYITLSSKYTNEHEIKDKYLWNAALLYATYNNIKDFKKTIETIKLTQKREEIIARLYFVNHKYHESWGTLSLMLNKKIYTSNNLLLLGDLYRVSNKDIHAMVYKYLKNNQALLNKNKSLLDLKPLFAKEQYFTQMYPLINEIYSTPKRSIASKTEIHLQLKERLNSVAAFLAEYGKRKKMLQKHINNDIHQISLDALCKASELTTKASISLENLKSPGLESLQWDDFVKKIDDKVAQLNSVALKEKNNCQKKRHEFFYISSLDNQENQGISPLCDSKTCFPDSPDFKKLIKLIQNNKNQTIIENLHQYLEIGAWAKAEELAYSIKDISERSLLIAIIRLANKDTLNAYGLLLKAKENSTLKSQINFLLGRIALFNGHHELAQKMHQDIVIEKLSDWQKDLIIKS